MKNNFFYKHIYGNCYVCMNKLQLLLFHCPPTSSFLHTQLLLVDKETLALGHHGIDKHILEANLGKNLKYDILNMVKISNL